MTPVNICSGFRKCGIYPFDANAFDCTISTDNPAGPIQQGAGDNEGGGGGDGSFGLINTPGQSPSLLRKNNYLRCNIRRDTTCTMKNIYNSSVFIYSHRA